MAIRGAVYVNGRIAPAAEAVVPVYDHGFLYGEGVYEVCRTYNGVVFLYDYHMRRLRQSARYIDLDVPFDDATLAKSDRGHQGGGGEMTEAYVRILLTRGVGETSYDPAATPTPVARHHRQAHRGSAGARRPRRHPHFHGVDPAQPSAVGQSDHQVEQSAQQRPRDAGGAPQGRRRGAALQLPRRAGRMFAVELLHRPRTASP